MPTMRPMEESGHLMHVEPLCLKKPGAQDEQRHMGGVDAYPIAQMLLPRHALGGLHATMHESRPSFCMPAGHARSIELGSTPPRSARLVPRAPFRHDDTKDAASPPEVTARVEQSDELRLKNPGSGVG